MAGTKRVTSLDMWMKGIFHLEAVAVPLQRQVP